MSTDGSNGRECCRSFLFLSISFLTLGGVVAILITCFFFSVKFRLFDANSSLMIYLIVALVVTIFLFLFTIWISCHKSATTRFLLAIAFLVFDIALLFISIFAFVKEKPVREALGYMIDHPKPGDQQNIVDKLEETFDCCGWDIHCRDGRPLCKDKIGEPLSSYWKAVAGVALGLGVILFIGVVFAFKFACTTNESYQPLVDSGARVDSSAGPSATLGPKYKW
jgi:hypothetical protein